MRNQTIIIQLIVLILFISSIKTTVYGQTSVIKGTVTDTLNKLKLENAVIYLKKTKDSSLVSYTRANKNGQFVLPESPFGIYSLVVTYPNYADWIDSLKLDGTNKFPIEVQLTTKAHLLQEVIVRQTIAPIRIKGDTTEYLADSFKVKAGATVEDLLKIMPGISVNSKGEITTQGQKVQKVLVDGDEFFGDDPTMATQNLNAKDVSKVQVFDKKSDQATLTGIDDGSKTKTVNLILKEDAKKGHFGKVEGGTDFNKYYTGKVTANKFTSTLKTGALITADRTGRDGFNWQEEQDFGNVSSTIENGEINFRYEGDGEFDLYNQQGIPESLQGAFMLNKKFGKNKSNTANNLNYNSLQLRGEGYTNTQYILPDTVFFNNQNIENKSDKWRQSISSKNEFNIDSLTTISFNAKGTKGKSNNYGLLNGEYLTGSGILVNKNNRTNTSEGDNSTSKADLFIRRKLNKIGTRTITLSTGFTNNQNNNDGFLLNKTEFYKSGNLNSIQIIDQRKKNIFESNSVQALVSYIEPLSKKMSLNLNYVFNSNNSQQDSRSFEKLNGKYDSLNLLFSNNFKFINSSHRGGFKLNYITKKLTIKAGLAIQDLSLKQTNIFNDSSFSRKFTNFFPTTNFQFKFSTNSSANLDYSGSTQQPSLSQLQPIINNNDPLSIVIGNPSLKPAFNHALNLRFNEYKVLSGKSIWAYANLNFIENAFSTKSAVDSLGRRITQSVNVQGIYNYNLNLSFNTKLKNSEFEIGFGPRISGGKNTNFVNGLENTTNRINGSLGLNLSTNIEKKMSFYFTYRAGYNVSTSSINIDAVTEFWTQSIYFDFSYTFKNDWIFFTDLSYEYRQKLSPTDRNNNVFALNTSVEKKLSKKNDLTAIFSVKDILNQRINFNRDISSNYITESSFTALQRIALISLRWKFNKNKKQSEDDE